MNKKTKNIVITGLMAAIIAVMSVWQIPVPLGVPLTFQVFAVSLSGYTLGRSKGTLAALLYVFIGAVGLPVFTGFVGGFSVLAGPSGGFIIGFLFLAFLCGVGSKKKTVIALLFGFLGLVLCHIAGILHFSLVTDTGVFASAAASSLPYLGKDSVLVLASFFISKPVKKSIKV